MPRSLVFPVRLADELPLHQAGGRQLHAMFLQLVQRVAPEIAEHFHDKTLWPRPFTLSPLFGDEEQASRRESHHAPWRPRDAFRRGHRCWFRVTSFGKEDIFPLLAERMLQDSLSSRLGPVRLEHEGILATQRSGHPWAGGSAWLPLIDETVHLSEIRLQIVSPTTFRQSRGEGYPQLELPLPLPELLFQTPLQAWEAFGALPPPDNLKEMIQTYVEIDFHRIRTEQVALFQRNIRGFLGELTLRIHKEAPPEAVHGINVLAELLFYTGTGYKTTMGMGMIRRIYR